MMFIAHLKLTIWHPRGQPRAGAERVRRENAAVELFMCFKDTHKFVKGEHTPKVQGKLWNIISESIMPTGRVN